MDSVMSADFHGPSQPVLCAPLKLPTQACRELPGSSGQGQSISVEHYGSFSFLRGRNITFKKYRTTKTLRMRNPHLYQWQKKQATRLGTYFKHCSDYVV